MYFKCRDEYINVFVIFRSSVDSCLLICDFDFFFSGFQGCLTVVTDFVGLFDVKYFRNFFFFLRGVVKNWMRLKLGNDAGEISGNGGR